MYVLIGKTKRNVILVVLLRIGSVIFNARCAKYVNFVVWEEGWFLETELHPRRPRRQVLLNCIL